MADTENPAGLASLSGDDFKSLLRRSRHALTRAVSHGGGLYLLAIVCTATFAISIRVAIPQLQIWTSRISQSVETLFRTELYTTPTRSIKPVLALITQALSSGAPTDRPYLECDPPNNHCPTLEVARKSVEDIYGLADTLSEKAQVACGDVATKRDCIRTLVESVRPAIARSIGGARAESVLGSLELVVEERTTSPDVTEMDDAENANQAGASDARNGKSVKIAGDRTAWDSRAAALMHECQEKLETAAPREGRAQLLPPAGCETFASAAGIRTLIPQQASNALMSSHAIDTKSDAVRLYNNFILASVLESRLFEYVVGRIETYTEPPPLWAERPRNGSGRNELDAPSAQKSRLDGAAQEPMQSPNTLITSEPSLVQAYFISIDSVLSIWDPLGDPSPLPQNRLWSQGLYFSSLLNSFKKVNKSEIYVDTGGNGLVRTYCYPIEGVHPNTELPNRGSFLGAVCFDFGLPASQEIYAAIAKGLQTNPLIKAAVVQLYTDNNRRVIDIRNPDGSEIQGDVLGFQVDDFLASLSRGNNDEVGKYVTDHDIRSTRLVVIPLARTSEQSVVALLMRPKGLSPPTPLVISAVVAATSVVGMLITIFRLGGSRRESKLDGQLARLRSLPVGVMETNAQHKVTWANDRAEELADCVLPKIGVTERSNEIPFDELFEDGVYVLDTPNAQPILRSNRKDVRPRRLAGQRSIYFAKTTLTHTRSPGPREWVKIIASPLLPNENARPPSESGPTVGNAQSWMPSFGVILECTFEERQFILELERGRKRDEPEEPTEQDASLPENASGQPS